MRLRLLIDTHTLIWYAMDLKRLPGRAKSRIESEENEVLVSAISAMEIAQKHTIGKLPVPDVLLNEFHRWVVSENFLNLEVTAQQAAAAGRMVRLHGDPFDRILAAQCLDLGIPIISNDIAFDTLGVKRIWD